MCLDHIYRFLGEMYTLILSTFLNWVICLFQLSEEFYVLDKIFVPILWLSFHFSDGLL